MRILKRSKNDKDVSNIRNQFLVFDVETTCLEPMPQNFVFGCLYGQGVYKTFLKVEDFIKEFEKPEYRGKIFFAHNAEFDLTAIFGNIFIEVDNAAIFNGKFISAKYGNITFADSMNIYPTSVANIGILMNLHKLENKKVIENKLRKNNITKEDKKYCMRDCKIVYNALLKIFEMTGVLKVTLPSLSLYDFRHKYLEKDLFFSELVDDFYESYYGGRTEAFYIGKCKAKVYDINSMYPYIMSIITLPDVKTLKEVKKPTIKNLMYLLKYYEGMTRVIVEHKKTYFGYLPCRMKINNVSKLVFPVGKFTTTVNFNELRFAVNAGIVKILKVEKIIYGNPMKSIFTDYINTNFEKRKKSTNELERTILKLKMNSLYGKFGQKVKMTTEYYEQVPYKRITELQKNKKYYDVKLFNSVRADCFLVTENEKFKNSFFSVPALSSYITSAARIYILQNLIDNEKNNVVYCDTDSIFLSGDFMGSVSDELGSFKLEEKKIVEIRGLKNYCYEQDGKKFNVIKGISKGSYKGKNSEGQMVFEKQSYHKTKGSLRRNVPAGSSYVLKKTLRNNYDKRIILKDGNTVPLNAERNKDNVTFNKNVSSYEFEYEVNN